MNSARSAALVWTIKPSGPLSNLVGSSFVMRSMPAEWFVDGLTPHVGRAFRFFIVVGPDERLGARIIGGGAFRSQDGVGEPSHQRILILWVEGALRGGDLNERHGFVAPF
jgi:hypothetical protein